MTKDELEAVAKPLRTVSAALGEVRSALRHGRPAGVDFEQLRGVLDGVAADLVAAQAVEIARTLAVRAEHLADDLTASYSGMTIDPVGLIAGLQALKAGLDVVERVLEEGEVARQREGVPVFFSRFPCLPLSMARQDRAEAMHSFTASGGTAVPGGPPARRAGRAQERDGVSGRIER